MATFLDRMLDVFMNLVYVGADVINWLITPITEINGTPTAPIDFISWTLFGFVLTMVIIHLLKII